MKKVTLALLFMLFSSLLIENYACSALFIKRDYMLLAKNFDWYRGEGMVIKNNRGINKTAYGLDNENTVKWTSKYGSVTFNQVGKEFPYGGVNEKGLAIEVLWLTNSYYEENGKPTLSELEWVQYHLDNYKTAAEVRVNLDSVSINPVTAGLHYIVSDRGGRSFVVDFINGKAVISTTKNEYQALTNSDYKSSLAYYEQTKDSIQINSKKSLDRYCQLMSKVNTANAKTMEGMFKILAESAVDTDKFKTYWSIVYDLKNYRFSFKTYDNQRLKTIELKSLDFDSSAPLVAMDINTPYIHWKLFNAASNKKLVNETINFFNIHLNVDKLNKHMMQPSKFAMDDLYSSHHKDLKINFTLKKNRGKVLFTLIHGKENFKSFKGESSGIANISQNQLETVIYSLPIKEYAFACFQDLDNDYQLKRGILGIPKEPYSFSNNVKGIFGLPPYKKAVFNLKETDSINIILK